MAAAAEGVEAGVPPAQAYAAPAEVVEYVTLDLSMVGWKHTKFNLNLTVKTTTKLHVIKQRLCERHGLLSSLRMYSKLPVNPENEMSSDDKTLKDYGITGFSSMEEAAAAGAAKITLFYDLVPYQSTDALLLVRYARGSPGVST